MKDKISIIKIISFLSIILLIIDANQKLGWSDYISNPDHIMGIKTAVGDNMLIVFLLYIVITIIGCVVLALPGVTFALIAGILFGPWIGIFACLIATTIGAMFAFLAGRFFLKDAVKPMLEKNKILQKLLFSGNERNDTIILMITRMVPLFPYNLQNFAYGITDISFWKYSVLTFIFMFPGVSFFTIGAAGITAEENKWLYFMSAGVLAILVTLMGMGIKKKFLPDDHLDSK